LFDSQYAAICLCSGVNANIKCKRLAPVMQAPTQRGGNAFERISALEEALRAQRRNIAHDRRLAIYRDAPPDLAGAQLPLLLIHSVNAAASAYEVRPLFDHYRGRRPVYALDLPGFGQSDRSDRLYSRFA
jgi:pimeloyl-ACP methyl ester carboxylesterase